jgi:hypothetical protein
MEGEVKRIKTCSVPGCEARHFGRGYCKHHYDTAWNHGDIDSDPNPTPHEQCHFVVTRFDNERWQRDNAQRLARWDAVRTDLWHQAHSS